MTVFYCPRCGAEATLSVYCEICEEVLQAQLEEGDSGTWLGTNTYFTFIREDYGLCITRAETTTDWFLTPKEAYKLLKFLLQYEAELYKEAQ